METELGSSNTGWEALLKQKLASIYASGQNSDLAITVGNSKKIFKVHGIILSLFSPVFRERIGKLNATNRKIHFQEFRENTMQRFLQYVYTGQYNFDWEDPSVYSAEVFNLFKLSIQLQFLELSDKCSLTLRNCLQESNLLDVYKFAMGCGHKQMIQFSLAYINRNGEIVLQQKSFADLPIDCVFEIVKQDQLCVKNELSVFNAILRWGEAECSRINVDHQDANQLRTVIQKLLTWVRFPQLSHIEFKDNVLPRKLLSIEETSSLLVYFMTPIEERNTTKEGQFISTPRIYDRKAIDKLVSECNRRETGTVNQIVNPPVSQISPTNYASNILYPQAPTVIAPSNPVRFQRYTRPTTTTTSYQQLTPTPLTLRLPIADEAHLPLAGHIQSTSNRLLRLILVLGRSKKRIELTGISPDETVLGLKSKIMQSTKYPICHSVIHKGVNLAHSFINNLNTLNDFGIGNGDSLILNEDSDHSQTMFCSGICTNAGQCTLDQFHQYCERKT